MIFDSYKMIRTSVWPIRIPYAPPFKIHENTLFLRLLGDSVFRLYVALGLYEGSIAKNNGGIRRFGESLFLLILPCGYRPNHPLIAYIA